MEKGVISGRSLSSSKSSATEMTTVNYLDGDILLRSSNEWKISLFSKGDYTHAGLCGKVEENVAIDAYPGRDPYAIAKSHLGEFFDEEHAPNGWSVFRFSGMEDAEKKSEKAEAARIWAEQQCDEEYFFDLFDPIVGKIGLFQWVFGKADEINENKHLYCSEFVWRCYRDGANVELVKPEDFKFIVLVRTFKPKHSGYFITPTQLAESLHTTLIEKKSRE